MKSLKDIQAELGITPGQSKATGAPQKAAGETGGLAPESAPAPPAQPSGAEKDPTGHRQQAEALGLSVKPIGARIDYHITYHGSKQIGMAQGVAEVRKWCLQFLEETSNYE